MNKTMCPGQDTRFWQPGDIFDSRCGNCGNTIEFFKDDASQRCKKCGTKVQNPRLNRGCAQWCEHAKECLGYDPGEESGEWDNVGYDMSLADKLLNEVLFRFGEESDYYLRAVQIKEKVESLMDIKGGKPRIALPAAILLHVDVIGKKGSEQFLFNKKVPAAKRILSEIGLDAGTVDEITDIILAFNMDNYLSSDEYRLVYEAASSVASH
jgi:ribosomal protein S27E